MKNKAELFSSQYGGGRMLGYMITQSLSENGIRVGVMLE